MKRPISFLGRVVTISATLALSFFALIPLDGKGVFADDDINLIVWNGETATTVWYGSCVNHDVFSGSGCFEGVPTASRAPSITAQGSGYRKDISGYDEIWFYAKCDRSSPQPPEPVNSIKFSITGTALRTTSSEVAIAPYIDGGVLDTTYRLVRIPMSALITGSSWDQTMQVMNFGKASNSSGYKIYIDEVWAVKLSSIDPNAFPLIQVGTDQDLGGVQIKSSSQKTLTITNIGTGPLVVSEIHIAGANSDEFSAATAAFTLPAGESRGIPITFSPQTFGAKTAVITLTHNASLSGTITTIALAGMGMAACIEPVNSSLDFGEVETGKTVSWKLGIQNTGNQDLVIGPVNLLHPVFTAQPQSLTIPAGQTGYLTIGFTPTETGDIASSLTVPSNDIYRPELNIDLFAHVVAASADMDKLSLRVDTITSSTIGISWPALPDVTGYNVYISPEPNAEGDEMLVATAPSTTTNYTIEKLAASCDVFIRVEASDSHGPVAIGHAYARTIGGPRAQLDTPLREVHLVAPNILMLVFLDQRVTSYTGNYHGEPAGYTGSILQAGLWRVVRKDEITSLSVQSTYRHSVPAGQNYYETGWMADTHSDLLDVEHRIYLVLDQAIGSGEILHVQGPLNTDVYIPFSDKYLETPVIQVNQVGYCPRATQRYAYVYAWLGDGGALPLDDFPTTADVLIEANDPLSPRTSTIAGIPIEPRPLPHGPDPDTGQERYENTGLDNPDLDGGAEVRQINLAAVPPAEGVAYRIRIPGVGVSWKTEISEGALFKAYYHITRTLYHQRWGRDLQPQWTDWSTRPPDHATVYTAEGADPELKFAEDTPQTGARPLSGGHHDAGDYDIRVWHYVVPLWLMNAYEANPAAFSDGQLIIPESDNGIPDILDEALYSLKAWEELQDLGDAELNITNYEPEAIRQNDGGIRLGVESYRHPYGLYYADIEPMPYWTYSKHYLHTARIAGLFAQASRLLKNIAEIGTLTDGQRQAMVRKAAELRERAIRAYAYAAANGANETTASIIFYVAGELYALTGDPQYLAIFHQAWDVNKMTYSYFRDGVLGLNIGTLLWGYYQWDSTTTGINFEHVLTYAKNPAANPAYVSYIKKYAEDKIQYALDRIEHSHGHRNGRAPWTESLAAPALGKATAVGQYLLGVYARMRLGDLTAEQEQDCINTMSLSVDYVLGCNPNGLAWVTGLGSRHPEDPDHHDALAFMRDGKGAIPGITVYGPNAWIPNISTYQPGLNLFYPTDPNTSHPVLLRYADFHYAIGLNEFTVGETMAPQAELFGALLKPGLMPTKDLLPRKAIFTSDVASGNKALTVHFTDDSNGPIEKWEWDFGDGSTSKEKSPVHTYTKAGTYTVSLKVACNGGTSEEVKTGFITVTGPRKVSLAASSETGDKGSVVVDFGEGNGIWVKDGESDWSILNAASAKTITTGDIDGDGISDIVVDFGEGNGIWASMVDGSWRPIHTMTAKSIVTADIDGNGIDDLVIDFGPGYGIWSYKNGMEWSLVHLISASSLARADINGDHADELVIDFGPGYGVWIYKNGGGYILLNPVSAREVTSGINIDNDAEGREEVIIDFGPGYGIWCFRNGAVWTLVNPASAKHIAVGDIDTADPRNDIVIDFGPGYGIWIYGNDTAWRLLNTISADSITVGDIAGTNSDDIIVDFGSSNGIWMYKDNASWEGI